MKRKPQPVDQSRRRLFSNALGLGAAGAGLTVFGVATVRSPDAGDAAKITPTSVEYHETEHIRRYYRTTW